MPAPMPQVPHGAGEPTVWQKMKMGAMMGTGVGLTIGFIFGSFTILRGGAGPRGALPTLSQYMLTSAATFGFFLSIGSVIRNDGESQTLSPQLLAAQYRYRIAAQNERSQNLRSEAHRIGGSKQQHWSNSS